MTQKMGAESLLPPLAPPPFCRSVHVNMQPVLLHQLYRRPSPTIAEALAGLRVAASIIAVIQISKSHHRLHPILPNRKGCENEHSVSH